jgi:hypothetical protein
MAAIKRKGMMTQHTFVAPSNGAKPNRKAHARLTSRLNGYDATMVSARSVPAGAFTRPGSNNK